jgi:hypothetical protein
MTIGLIPVSAILKPTSWLYETRIGTHQGQRRAGPAVGSSRLGFSKNQERCSSCGLR